MSESAESLVILVEVGFHAGHQQNRMVIQHRIGLGQFKMTTLPHTHHVHSVLFPKVRILQLFSHQRSTVNRGFGDQDFVKPTDQVSVVVGAAYSASQKASHLLGRSDDVIGSRQGKDVFGGFTIASSDYGQIRRCIPCPKGDIYVSNVVIRSNHHFRIRNSSILESVGFVQVAEHHGYVHIVQAEGLLHRFNHKHERVAELGQFIHESMTDRVIVCDYDVLLFRWFEFPRYAGSGLVLHERLVKKFHEDKRKYDK